MFFFVIYFYEKLVTIKFSIFEGARKLLLCVRDKNFL